jgi:hypothetical protein
VVASQHFDGHVDWLVSSPARAAVLRRGAERGGLRSIGVLEARADRLRTISSEPADVIPGADIAMIVVPAFAHASVLDRIEPYLDEAAIVGCLPARGGFEFEAWRLTDGRDRLFGLQTLPWSARIVTPGEKVLFNAIKSQVVLTSPSQDHGSYLTALLPGILRTELVPVEGFLNLTLGNPGQLIHPGLMYGHFRHWDGKELDRESIPLFYAEATDEMGAVVEGLSRDTVGVAQALQGESGGTLGLRGVVPIHDWLRGAYSHVTADPSTVATCFRTGPLRERRAPMTEVGPDRFVPDFGYRYLSEDIPYGLAVTKAIAEIAEIATPAIDEVIAWAQDQMDKTYLAKGGTLTGPDVHDLPIPQNHGISTLHELVTWYSEQPSAPLERPAVTA